MSSEGIAAISAPNQEATFEFEDTIIFYTGDKRWSKAVSSIDRVKTCCETFASVVLQRLEAEAIQTTLVGSTKTTLFAGGACFFAVIPTNSDTDARSGTNASTILSVPRKTAFPLSSLEQTVKHMVFNLNGYELDLAQDPRRGAGPVMWVGNTGVTVFANESERPIFSITFRGLLKCSGTTALF